MCFDFEAIIADCKLVLQWLSVSLELDVVTMLPHRGTPNNKEKSGMALSCEKVALSCVEDCSVHTSSCCLQTLQKEMKIILHCVLVLL